MRRPSPELLEQNRVEVWLKWYSTCFASSKPRARTPVPSKGKKKRQGTFWGDRNVLYIDIWIMGYIHLPKVI
jgi:hypothetical protein